MSISSCLVIVIFVVLAIGVSTVHSATQTRYNNGAVATDVANCSKMGRNILQKNGSAVDSAITSMLCIGVANGQSSGIGGGFFMVIYNRSNAKVDVLNAVETAIASADPAIFDGDKETNEKAKYGFQAFGIPGEIKGMWEAHQRYGKLPWKDLFEPVIDMAQNGFKVGEHLASKLKFFRYGARNAAVRELYTPGGKNRIARVNETIKLPILAATLRRIADNGCDEFYNSTMQTAINLIHDVQEGGGSMTYADLEGYNAEWVDAEILRGFSSSNYTVYSSQLTSSGAYIQFMLRVMDEYLSDQNIEDMSLDEKVDFYHHWIEVSKFAHGARTRLGDTKSSQVNETLEKLRSPEYASYILGLIDSATVTSTSGRGYADQFDEDVGDTSHVSVLGPNGDAVSVTTSIGHYFGSRAISESTGIVLNNRMYNFDYDWRFKYWSLPENTLAPGKRPLSTMGPSIIVDELGDVKMIVGSSGGMRIPSANAWVIIRTLLMDVDLEEAIEEKRIYNYIMTNKAFYEEDFCTDVVDALDDQGHRTEQSGKYATVQGITRYDDGIAAHSDTRKGGVASGY